MKTRVMRLFERIIAIAICIGVAIMCGLGVVHYGLSLPGVSTLGVLVCGTGLAVALIMVGLLLCEFLRDR